MSKAVLLEKVRSEHFAEWPVATAELFATADPEELIEVIETLSSFPQRRTRLPEFVTHIPNSVEKAWIVMRQLCKLHKSLRDPVTEESTVVVDDGWTPPTNFFMYGTDADFERAMAGPPVETSYTTTDYDNKTEVATAIEYLIGSLQPSSSLLPLETRIPTSAHSSRSLSDDIREAVLSEDYSVVMTYLARCATVTLLASRDLEAKNIIVSLDRRKKDSTVEYIFSIAQNPSSALKGVAKEVLSAIGKEMADLLEARMKIEVLLQQLDTERQAREKAEDELKQLRGRGLWARLLNQ